MQTEALLLSLKTVLTPQQIITTIGFILSAVTFYKEFVVREGF